MHRPTKRKIQNRPTSPKLQPVGEQVIEGLTSLVETLRKGEPLDSRFTVRTVFRFDPRDYTPNQIKAVRRKLGASQAAFAQILAVTPKALQRWEQGKPTPRIARRLLDLIDKNPEPWSELLKAASLQ